MPTTTVIDNEFASLWYNPEKKIVHHKIKKWIQTEEFKKVLNKGHDLTAQHQAKKWLSDDRLNGALTPEFEKWAREDWFARMVKLGWKYWAVVLPEKVVGQLGVKRHFEEYSKVGVTAKLFTDSDEAMKWLEAA